MAVQNHRPVFVCGENPMVSLFGDDPDQPVAVVSFWNVTWSEAGAGKVLVLWAADPSGPQGVSPWAGLYSEDRVLADHLVGNLTRYFPEFARAPIHELPHRRGVCVHGFDGSGGYRVECQTSSGSLVVGWNRVLDRKLVVYPGFPTGPRAFDLTTVICPCGEGTITCGGQVLPGAVRVAGGDNPSSSAFLAFAETWVGPVAGP